MRGSRIWAGGVAGALGALVLAGCGTRPAMSPSATSPSATSPGATSPGAIGPSAGNPSAKSPGATGPTPGSPAATSPTPTAARDACARLVGKLSPREQVGQLFMVGVPSSGLSASTARILSKTRAGSVIFLGNTTAGVAGVRELAGEVRRATRRPSGIGTLLAVDQEGGTVQRLKGAGFADMASARTQGTWSSGRLRSTATRWGSELREADIDADLAPVADVVPNSMTSVNQPIGVLRRNFGADPDVVAGHAGAFVAGMDRAGIATAVKHFPGLGQVRGNTDLVSRVVDSTTTRDDRDLAGFQAAVEAGVDMVMVSSAYYTEIDPDTRAAFSPTVIEGMIRHDLRFDRVVISDDLAAPGTQDLRPGTRALRFLKAGGDLVIVGDAGQLDAMVEAVADEAAASATFRAMVGDAARRVLAMKAKRGLASC